MSSIPDSNVVNPFTILLEKELCTEEQEKVFKYYSEEWTDVPTPEKLRRVRNAMKDFPENAMLQAVFSELKIQWKKEQEQIAQKHVIVYEKDNEPVGYTFNGHYQAKQKWILCGTEEFVNMYRGVICDEAAEAFKSFFKRCDGHVDTEVLNILDEKYAKTHKYERIMRTLKGQPIEDSGWIKLNN